MNMKHLSFSSMYLTHWPSRKSCVKGSRDWEKVHVFLELSLFYRGEPRNLSCESLSLTASWSTPNLNLILLTPGGSVSKFSINLDRAEDQRLITGHSLRWHSSFLLMAMATSNPSAPLNAEPSRPGKRESQGLKPKSYVDAVIEDPAEAAREAVNGTSTPNGVNGTAGPSQNQHTNGSTTGRRFYLTNYSADIRQVQ